LVSVVVRLLNWGEIVERNVSEKRAERRLPMEVGVRISVHPKSPGIETTFTDDVSPRGARVLTARRWKTDDYLKIFTVPKNFQATARVAYCRPLRGEGYVIGPEFLEPAGTWVVPPRTTE
jgi:hypothetical protein